MVTELQVKTVLDCLAETIACFHCGCRIRLGDQDCPHCGADLEEPLRQWAEQLLERLDKAGNLPPGGNLADAAVQALAARLSQAQNRVLQSIEGVSEAEAHTPPAAGQWTVAEIMGHVTELQGYWLGKMRLMIEGGNPTISRNRSESEERVAATRHSANFAPPALAHNFREATRQTLAAINSFRASDLDCVGQRGRDGSTTVRGVIETMAKHLEEHAGQIAAAAQQARQRR